MKEENHLDNDLFEESGKTYNLFTLAFVVFAAVALVSGSWYLYKSYKDKSSDEVVIISADHDEVKIKPENPGGMVVDNMDKSIYDTIDNNNKKDQVINEKTLPPVEEPIDKKSLTVPMEAIDKKPIEVQDDSSKEQDVTASNNVGMMVTKEEKAKDNKDVEEYIKPVVAKKSIAKQDIKLSKKHDHYYKVQIGSFKSKNDAIKEWNSLLKRFPKMLAKHEHHIVIKNIEGKGIFHRLQVGQFNSDSNAREACNEFKAEGLNCFIIKP